MGALLRRKAAVPCLLQLVPPPPHGLSLAAQCRAPPHAGRATAWPLGPAASRRHTAGRLTPPADVSPMVHLAAATGGLVTPPLAWHMNMPRRWQRWWLAIWPGAAMLPPCFSQWPLSCRPLGLPVTQCQYQAILPKWWRSTTQ